MKTLNVIQPPPTLTKEVIAEIAETNKDLVNRHNQIKTYEGLIQVKAERKEREASLRPLMLNIGMVLSIGLAILAINWKTYDQKALMDLGQVEMEMNEIIEVPISEQPPPPPVKQEVFQIAEVKDTEVVEELELTLDVEVTENEALEEIEYVAPLEEEEVEEIFVIVEQEPMPVGGFEAFYTYMAEELKYPSAALRLDISGTVYVEFVIEKDGTITQVKTVKGIGAGCNEEAVRVIENAAPWLPGKQRGKAVRVKKIIPVKFILH